MGKRELIDIAGELRGETEKAYRIYDGKTTEWVPKSQVEKNPDGTFTMPEWLAQLAPPRSQRHAEIYAALKRELTMQLKFEMRTTTSGEEETPVRLSPTNNAA